MDVADIAENQRAVDFVHLALQPELNNQEMRSLQKKAKKEGKKLGKKPNMRKLFREGEWNGLRIIDFAASGGHKTLLDILVTSFDMNPALPDADFNKSPLHHAAQFGHDTVVEALITEHSCPIDATDSCGSTPVNVAIFNGKNSTLEILLKHGASVEVRNFFGLPLHCAAFKGNDYAVQRLYGVNAALVDDVVFGFCTPIAAAICSGSLNCVHFLAPVTDITQMAILSKAVGCMSSEDQALECVNLLLGCGADANLLNEALFEELPIIIAAKHGWNELVQTLLNHTDQIEGIDWSTDGLIGYVNSEGFKEMDVERKQIKVNNLRDKIIQELRDNHYLAAEVVHSALRADMDEETWHNFGGLCTIHRIYAEASKGLSCDVDELVNLGWVMFDMDQEDVAITTARACMALDPENEECKRLMASMIQKYGHAPASTSGSH